MTAASHLAFDILDVGCGLRKSPAAIGIDSNPRSDADIIHDLDILPWPFKDSIFSKIILNNILEHLADIPAVMREVHRISNHRAVIDILVPHYSSSDAYTDTTHQHFFGMRSFDRFCGGYNEFAYDEPLFKLEKISLQWWRIERFRWFKPAWLFFGMPALARLWPSGYERFLAWICPAQSIQVQLRVVKK